MTLWYLVHGKDVLALVHGKDVLAAQACRLIIRPVYIYTYVHVHDVFYAHCYKVHDSTGSRIKMKPHLHTEWPLNPLYDRLKEKRVLPPLSSGSSHIPTLPQRSLVPSPQFVSSPWVHKMKVVHFIPPMHRMLTSVGWCEHTMQPLAVFASLISGKLSSSFPGGRTGLTFGELIDFQHRHPSFSGRSMLYMFWAWAYNTQYTAQKQLKQAKK